MAGTIYLVTNTLNGKQYVGQTTVASEKRGHGQLVISAYRKYGKKNFSYEPICSSINSRSTLNFIERFWIKVMDCRIPNGYNIDHGGSTKGKVSKETCEKLSKSLTGFKHSDEAKARMSAAQLRRPKEIYELVATKTRGLKRSPEFCKMLGERSKGNVLSEETKAKIRLARSKQVITEEHKLKLSEAAKKQWARQRGELSSLAQ